MISGVLVEKAAPTGEHRERAAQRPAGTPIRLRPDWVCEILSASNARDDQVTKFETYRRCGVPHDWMEVGVLFGDDPQD